jgi:hypothetical protein
MYSVWRCAFFCLEGDIEDGKEAKAVLERTQAMAWDFLIPIILFHDCLVSCPWPRSRHGPLPQNLGSSRKFTSVI